YMLHSDSENLNQNLFCPEDSEIAKINSSIKSRIFTYKKLFGFDIFAARKLKNICRENKIDLIHLHDSHAINTFLLAGLMGMNIPAVIHRHVNFTIKSKWKYTGD